MPAQPNGTLRPSDADDEVCPVCKSSRYLNPDMRFLINPECYHKMCESCVDRIFSAGPAPCPVAGCRRTLRKNRFRKQTFDDIHVEREVDIRKRVMDILNRREDEFASLQAYNDFLEQRESIIANLVSRTDVAQTEAQLSEYASANTTSITRNKQLESQESASSQLAQSQEHEAQLRRRDIARQESEAERRAKLVDREGLISRLATGTKQDADAIARDARRDALALKKPTSTSARRAQASSSRNPAIAAVTSETEPTRTSSGAGLIKGLKPISTPEPEKPYDPFDGYANLLHRDYFTAKTDGDYPSTYLDPIRRNASMLAGGYDLQEYYGRTLLEAFAGLGCFVDEEVRVWETQKENGGPATMGTLAS